MSEDLLHRLSNIEHSFYEEVVFRLNEQALGVLADKYRNVHNQYLELYDTSSDLSIKVEALKRLIFLNWYSVTEPVWFTGINELDASTVTDAYIRLNDFMTSYGLDEEFKWMLSVYSCWDYLVLPYVAPASYTLIDFVTNVDKTLRHSPHHQLTNGTMDDRGQMGIYWQSCSVEVKPKML
jgi:hypothetical protein